MKINDILNDLAVRFISMLPDEELESWERLFFQLEQAHWFYCDFYMSKNAQLPQVGFKTFSRMMFRTVDLLKPWVEHFDTFYDKFRHYFDQVPVCGCIVLNANMDSMCLVKSFQGSSWGFPKGKINKNERDIVCALREVKEETGFALSPGVSASEIDNIEKNNRLCVTNENKGTSCTLFIIPDCPNDFKFETMTRGEIGDIQWFDIGYVLYRMGIKPKADAPGAYPYHLGTEKLAKVLRFMPGLCNWIVNEGQKHLKPGVVIEPQLAYMLQLGAQRKVQPSQHGVQHSGGQQQQQQPVKPAKKQEKKQQVQKTNTHGGGKKNTSRQNANANFFNEGTDHFTYDDADTFGSGQAGGRAEKGWDVEAMFATNANQFGVQAPDMNALSDEERARGEQLLNMYYKQSKEQRKGGAGGGKKGGGNFGNTKQKQQRGKHGYAVDSDAETFGAGSSTGRWDAEEMFATNMQQFGVDASSTMSYDTAPASSAAPVDPSQFLLSLLKGKGKSSPTASARPLTIQQQQQQPAQHRKQPSTSAASSLAAIKPASISNKQDYLANLIKRKLQVDLTKESCNNTHRGMAAATGRKQGNFPTKSKRLDTTGMDALSILAAFAFDVEDIMSSFYPF